MSQGPDVLRSRCPQYWHKHELRCRFDADHDGECEYVFGDRNDPGRESIEDAAQVDGEQEPTVVKNEQMRLFNGLPADDRKLLLLRFGNEIKVESKDPDEFTLAKHYGVEGRTIRNRLKAALARLAKLEMKS